MEAGDIIRRREALGLSRPDLAAAIGVSHPTVWRWEQGKSRPSGLALRQLEATFKRLEANQARRAARRAAEPANGL